MMKTMIVFTAFSESCFKEAHIFFLKCPDPEMIRNKVLKMCFEFKMKLKQKGKLPLITLYRTNNSFLVHPFLKANDNINNKLFGLLLKHNKDYTFIVVILCERAQDRSKMP